MKRRFFSWFARRHSTDMIRCRAERRRRTPRAQGFTGLGFENLEDRRLLTAGALDPTFGTGGIVVDNLQTGKDDHVFTVATQTVLGDDKLVVAGFQNTTGSPNDDVMVARYNSDGTRDLTFGTGGVTVFNASDSLISTIDAVHNIIVDDQNRILLVGTAGTTAGSSDVSGVLIVRLTEGGLLDSSFDGDGQVITVVYDASSQPVSVRSAELSPRVSAAVLQADGKIVVGTSTNTSFGTKQDFVLLRYKDDGSLDSSFDSDGYVLTDFSGDADELADVAIQSDGKIVAVGATMAPSGIQDFGIVRYNDDGSRDMAFGVDGKVITDVVPPVFVSQDFATSVLVEPDGQIVVGGYTDVRFSSASSLRQRSLVVARYNDDGSLDDATDSTPLVTFGTSGDNVAGTALIDMNGPTVFNDSEQSFAMVAQPQPDGKYLIGSHFGSSTGNRKFGVARLLPTDGSLDTSFDGDGKTEAVFAGQGFLFMSDLVLQPDGKIVAAGYQTTIGGDIDVAMARFDLGLLVADAGGPYVLDEPGGSVALSGSGVGAGTLTYDWDLDNDGIFGETGATNAPYGDETGPSPTFTVSGVDGPTVFDISLRVSSDENNDTIIDQIAYDSTTVTVNNVDPVITVDNATSTADEGTTATNSGTFSDVPADPVTLSASIGVVLDNGNGTWSWSFDTSDGPVESQLVTITADDGDGGINDVSFDLVVNNLPPTADAGGPYTTIIDTPVVLNGSGSDVPADSLSYEWFLGAVEDGVLISTDANTSFDPEAFGILVTSTVTVTLRVTDDDGDFALATADVSVLGPGAWLVDDMLYVIGTNQDDIVAIRHNSSDLKVAATFLGNNPQVFSEASVAEIVVRVRGGDDVGVVTNGVVLSATLDGGSGNDVLTAGGGDTVIYGGPGNDVLIGGRGDNVLIGGSGQDVIAGGAGRDLLIGGLDGDVIVGGGGDDILIGGWTIYDENTATSRAAIDNIMAIWTSSSGFDDRVTTLTEEGALLEAGEAVFDDDATDLLAGGGGHDLLFADVNLWDGTIDLVAYNWLQDALVPLE